MAFDAMISPEGLEYFRILEEFDREHSLVTAKAECLLALVGKVLDRFGRSFYEAESTCDMCNRILWRIFEYDSFKRGDCIKEPFGKFTSYHWGQDSRLERWDSAELIRKSGIRYCPYCNAETVYVIPKSEEANGEDDYRSALDHFLPRSTYPFLGLSIYNLIPSCTRCNTSYKQKRDPLSLLRHGVLPRDGRDMEALRAAHPYIEDIYGCFCMRFSLRGGRLSLRYTSSEDDALSRSRALMENMFRWSQTYTSLFMLEAKNTALVLMKLRPVYVRMIKSAFPHAMLPSLGRMVCGFDMRNEDFMNHRLGKLKIDLYKRYA